MSEATGSIPREPRKLVVQAFLTPESVVVFNHPFEGLVIPDLVLGRAVCMATWFWLNQQIPDATVRATLRVKLVNLNDPDAMPLMIAGPASPAEQEVINGQNL